MKHYYKAQSRNGYGAIDRYRVDESEHAQLEDMEMGGGWLTQKAARWIADSLNQAYALGREDAGEDEISWRES